MMFSRFRTACWFALLATAAAPSLAATACPAVLNHTLPRLQDEKPVNLCNFAGQVVVVVNTASQCGFTPQYKSLDALQARYKQRGLVVLGFPSNDFGQQEPGDNKAIAEFCENQFAVKFPMFAKSNVSARSGGTINPLYASLTAATGKAPGWNFHKYIVSRDGRFIQSQPSDVDPMSPGFLREIEKQLDAPK